MSITIEYLVPVYVVVEDGRVSKVVVDDENADFSESSSRGAYDEDGHPIEESDEVRAARALIAGGEGDWPAWEFGW